MFKWFKKKQPQEDFLCGISFKIIDGGNLKITVEAAQKQDEQMSQMLGLLIHGIISGKFINDIILAMQAHAEEHGTHKMMDLALNKVMILNSQHHVKNIQPCIKPSQVFKQ